MKTVSLPNGRIPSQVNVRPNPASGGDFYTGINNGVGTDNDLRVNPCFRMNDSGGMNVRHFGD
jgi:hypothetical protein